MSKMIRCTNCTYEGCVEEFPYVAQAGGRGPETLRRCPACYELVIVDELETEGKSILTPEPSGSGNVRGERVMGE